MKPRPTKAVDGGLIVVWTLGIAFGVLFGSLALSQHRSFGTFAFDLGIYDQGFWLASRGKAFVTVRGLNFWGHHLNLISFLYLPAYWLGAGAGFLVFTQAIVLGIGAVPVYLLAHQRCGSKWYGWFFAVAYLLYPAVEWLTHANFHPEALAVTPLLFAWWYLRNRRWRPFLVAAGLALATREDVALALVIMGAVVALSEWYRFRRSGDAQASLWRYRGAEIAVGAAVYYLVVTIIVLPAFNRWHQPFYVSAFYGDYGSSGMQVALNLIRRPDRLAAAAAEPDRLRFYRDLLLPWGGLPFAGLEALLMAVPQMVASTISNVPYPRSIRFQYTSVMIAPVTIAAIEGISRVRRWFPRRGPLLARVAVVWVGIAMWTSNTAWSPAPWSANASAWIGPSPRSHALADAVALVPPNASVTASYQVVPHLTHREAIYDWPNPWREVNWGVNDQYRYPNPATVEYVVLVTTTVTGTDRTLIATEIEPYYTTIFEREDVVVYRRVTTQPNTEQQPASGG